MRVLVTGGTGFLGRAIVAELQAAGHTVTAAGLPGSERELPEGVAFEQLDFFDESSCSELLAQQAPDTVVHLAWCVDPATYLHTAANSRWLQATLRFFEQAAAAGVKRFVGAGTCFEYDLSAGYLREGGPCVPHTLYGACKLATAMALEKLAPTLGISFAWMRFFFLHGAGEPPTRLVPAVIGALLRGEVARVSEGSQVRDFLALEDAALAVRHVVESDITGPVNLCSGVPVRVRDVVATLVSIAEERGLAPRVDYGAFPVRPGDPPFLCGDATRLRGLGFRPRFDLRSGLARTFASFAESP